MKYGSVKNILDKIKLKRVVNPSYGLFNYMADTHQATPEMLYKELSVDPRTWTVELMFSTSEDTKWLMIEIIRDAIILGMKDIIFKDRLLAGKDKAPSSKIEMPHVDVSGVTGTKGKETAKGATIQTDTVELGTKYYTSEEVGKGIKCPLHFNQIKRLKLDILPLFFKKYGMMLMRDCQELIIELLLNGNTAYDKGNNPIDESPVVIGVNNTGDGISEDDYLRGVTIMAEAGNPVSGMMAESEVMSTALKWATFRAEKHDKTETTLDLVIPLPSKLTAFPTQSIPSQKMMLVCLALAVIEYLVQGLTIDEEVIASTLR